VFYGPPVTVERTGDRERDAWTVTAQCTAVIEQWVRKHPELWLWMHRRWKTRPPEDPA
jgi:KDO2-lipid IV(A) lauroyltransferase